MRGTGLWIVAMAVGTAAAQPVLPTGFVATRIAPVLDGQQPGIEGIQDADFGYGVVAATASNGVVVFRLISDSGIIRTLGTWTDAPLNCRVQSVRFDRSGVIGSLIHATIRDLPAVDTHYITLDREGSVFERWERTDSVSFRFDIVEGISGLPDGAVLLDSDGGDGTQLASMNIAYDVTIRSANSVPPGRSDVDFVGEAFDPTGLYGGSVLFADSDCNNDNRSAIYELTDIDSGGSYRRITDLVTCQERYYGGIDIVSGGVFGGALYVLERVADEIQLVDPTGTHTTWASGIVDPAFISISPDGNSLYVTDQSGVWLIRPEGNEPGPAVVAHDPSTPTGTPMAGNPITSARLIFSEPVSFTDADVTITNADGTHISFDASGSGSQFMIIGFATPLEADTYTITVADTLTAVATGRPLDGDNDGVAGGSAEVVLTHRCNADLAAPTGLLDLSDITAFIDTFVNNCE